MTQPRRTTPAGYLTSAVQDASRAAIAMAVVAVALVGTDTAVAVHRTASTSHSGLAAGPRSTVNINAEPGIAVSPPAGAVHGPKAAQPAPIDPKSLLAKATADALSAGSVHAVARDVSKHFGTAVFDDYDAMAGGIQHISIYGGHVAIRVVGSRTFYTGDRRGLIRYFRFTTDEVAVLHHKWLQLTKGEAGYREVTAGVTLPSALREDRIAPPLRLLRPRTVNAAKAVGVRGHARNSPARHAIATMWISVGPNPLPVEYDLSDRNGRLTQTFSDWGKRRVLAPPTNLFGHKRLAT